MSDYKLPPVDFTKEELTYLQNLIDDVRANWFNCYEEHVEEGDTMRANRARRDYEMCQVLRNKLYHMNGRDTLAPGVHEQRWWDQGHDYTK